MAGVKILACQNASCTSLGATHLVRDLEELAQGRCEVEEWGCLGKCGKGPNVELQWKGGKVKVVEGVKAWKKTLGLITDKAEIDVSGSVKKLGKIKYEARREENSGAKLAKIKEGFDALGGEAGAANSEPRLAAELLVMRSREVVKTQAADALKDAQLASQLASTWAQAKLALGNAAEAMNMPKDALTALQEALDIGKGINKPAVKRQITRLTRKAEAMEAAGETPGPPSAAEAPAAAPAPPAPAPAPAPTPAPAAEKPAGEVKKASSGKKQVAPKPKAKSSKTGKQGENKSEKKGDTKEKSSKEKSKTDKKDVKEKEAEKVEEPVQRSPLDFIEWNVESIEKLNHNCVLMTLYSGDISITRRDPDPGGIWHVDFLKEGDGGEELKRSYTPISKFDAYRKGTLEIMVKIYPDGQMTQYLASLAAGSKLLVSPPVVTENLEGYRDLVMIAGGSAVTVAIQICEDALRRNPVDVPVDLLLCNRTLEDILYQDVFGEMLGRYPAFRLVHCISGAIPEQAAEFLDRRNNVEWHSGHVNKEVFRVKAAGSRCIVSGPRGLCQAGLNIWKSLGHDMELLSILDELPPEAETGAGGDDGEGSTAGGTLVPTTPVAAKEVIEEAAPWPTLAAAVDPREQQEKEAPEIPPPPQLQPRSQSPAGANNGVGSIFCNLWRPFWCQGRTADKDDGEGIPSVGQY